MPVFIVVVLIAAYAWRVTPRWWQAQAPESPRPADRPGLPVERVPWLPRVPPCVLRPAPRRRLAG